MNDAVIEEFVSVDERLAALSHLQWVHLEVTHQLQGALSLEAPYSLGALYRSVFGLGLHEQSEDAFQLFAGDQDDVLRPWWLWPPEIGADTWLPAGVLLQCRLTLQVQALPHLDACLEAMSAFGEHGLGRQRVSAVLTDVRVISPSGPVDLGATAPERWTADAVWVAAQQEAASGHVATLAVQAHTPLRLKEGGQILRSAPSLETLVQRCLGRAQLLLPEGSGALLTRDAKATLLAACQGQPARGVALGSVRVPRYSARQKRAMEIDGLVGTWSYAGADVSRVLPWLRLAEHLQVGGKTTLGFGAMRVHCSP